MSELKDLLDEEVDCDKLVCGQATAKHQIVIFPFIIIHTEDVEECIGFDINGKMYCTCTNLEWWEIE